jgi:hypothetical protein
MKPLQQHPYGFGEELLQAGGVAMDAVIMVRPTALGGEPLAQAWQALGAVLLTPRGAALERGPAFLACGPALEVLSPLAILAPPTLKPQQCATRLSCLSVPTDRDEPCLGA